MNQQKINFLMPHVFRILLMASLLVAASAIGYLFKFLGFPETNIVIVYLLAVLMTAWLTHGFAFGILASMIATISFNYLFTEPYFTLSVNDPSYIVTFIIMTITALVTSTLTSHVKQSALSAREKEAETKALFKLTNHLTDAEDMHNIACIAVSALYDCFLVQAALLCFDENGMPESFFIQQISEKERIRRVLENPAALKQRTADLRTEYDMNEEFCDWPIHGRENILGLIRIPKEKALLLRDAQKRLLHSIIESTALAMDRFRSAEQRSKLRQDAIEERYRGNLLRAISHDLRTPLSGIIGTSEMLMDMTASNDTRYSLAEGIHKDAYWLYALVENILSLTRLQNERIVLNKQMEAVEEVIGSAVSHVSKRSPEHEITVSVPAEFLLVPMDARLIEQVLVNLLDNAIKHTPKENEIVISVTKDTQNHRALFSVKDRGLGIPATDLPNIFQMFYTSHIKHSDAVSGIGLGLAICDAIIKAHGGNIEAHNRTDGPGAEFIFTLPLEETNNEKI